MRKITEMAENMKNEEFKIEDRLISIPPATDALRKELK
jgi:hypothetical protein